jgi:hypothetical protein
MNEPAQLELFDPYDDGLTFGEWIESLPRDPSEKGRSFLHEPAPPAARHSREKPIRGLPNERGNRVKRPRQPIGERNVDCGGVNDCFSKNGEAQRSAARAPGLPIDDRGSVDMGREEECDSQPVCPISLRRGQAGSDEIFSQRGGAEPQRLLVRPTRQA